MRLASVAASLALLSTVSMFACSAAPTDDAATGNEQAQTSIKALTVVKGREWGRCYFQNIASGVALLCTSTKRADNDPLATTVKITATSLSPAFVSASKVLDTENGGTVVVGAFARDAFPVTVLFDAVLPNEAGDSLGLRHARDLQSLTNATTPEQLTQAQPLVFSQPFDLWPTGLIAERADGGFAANATYQVATGPLAPFASQPVLPIEASFFSRDYKGKIRYWVAPASGGITIGTNQTISGPGYFTVTSNGLRGATPEEILRDFPGAGEGTPTPAPEVDAGPAPAPDAAPVDAGPANPTPGCGGNDEARCADNTCDPATRLDSSTNKCVSCGNDGQTYCYAADGFNKSCNAATRLDSSTNKCVSCGNDGQTYCYAADGFNKSCNAATRLDSSTNKCVSCGNDGQTYCYAADGFNKSCNAATRLDSSTNKCVSCGNDGQTYCYAADGFNKVCNAGTHYDSNTSKCKAN